MGKTVCFGRAAHGSYPGKVGGHEKPVGGKRLGPIIQKRRLPGYFDFCEALSTGGVGLTCQKDPCYSDANL